MKLIEPFWARYKYNIIRELLSDMHTGSLVRHWQRGAIRAKASTYVSTRQDSESYEDVVTLLLYFDRTFFRRFNWPIGGSWGVVTIPPTNKAKTSSSLMLTAVPSVRSVRWWIGGGYMRWEFQFPTAYLPSRHHICWFFLWEELIKGGCSASSTMFYLNIATLRWTLNIIWTQVWGFRVLHGCKP